MKLSALLHSKLAIGIAAGVAAAAAAVTGFLLMNQTDEYRVIKVFDKTGKAVVSRPDVGDIDPYVGMNLENGDTVCTYKESTMHINLDDNKYMLMEPETKVELEASGNETDSKTRIVLKSGSVLNEVTKPLSSDSSYEVTAPKATMAVQGTSFRVSIEKDENGDYITKLYVFEGTVKVTLLDESGNKTDKTVSVTKDRCVTIKTVHNEHSGNDPSVDGTSYFVFDDGNGDHSFVGDDEDPTTSFDYETIPYETLLEVYTTDQEDEIVLNSEVLRKVIEAMNKKKGTTTTTTTTTTTSASESSSGESTTTTTTTASSSGGGTTVPTTTTTTSATVTTTTTTVSGGTTTPSGTSSSGSSSSSSSSGSSSSSSNSTTASTTASTTGSTSASTSGSTSGSGEDPEPPTKKYTVNFRDRDKTIISTQIIEAGKAAAAPTNFTRSYRTDDGDVMEFYAWDVDFSSVTRDMTVNPLYKARARFSVEFLDYDGKTLSTQKVVKGESASAPTNYTKSYKDSKTGYTMLFDGWDTDFENVQKDLTVKATYKAKTRYAVEFRDYDGSVLKTQIVETGDAATAPTDYTESYKDSKTGYTMLFDGWDNKFDVVEKDLTVNAVYKSKTRYAVEFRDYDGSVLKTQIVETGDAATAPTDYTESYKDSKTGYTMLFDGWDNKFDVVEKDLTVTAVYKAKARYAVEFRDYDGSVLKTQIVETGDAATAPTDYTESYKDSETGYTMLFDGWDNKFDVVEKDLTVTAVYKAKARYAVEFRDYDGSVLKTQIVETGDAATAPTDYTESYDTDSGKVRHTFTGWDQAFNKVTEPLEIKPEYAVSYRVRFFDYDNKQIGTSQYVANGEDATAPTTYTESYTVDGVHYTFSGWDNAYTGVMAAVDVTAQYGESYEVKFYDYDGTQLGETQVIKSGKSATAPSDYTATYDTDSGKVRHTFTGWDQAFNKVTEPLEIKPEYVTSYRVRFFDYDNKQIGESQYVAEGEDATAPTTYTKSYTVGGVHYTFSGWDNAFTGISAAVDVTAQYGESYEVKFYDYDNTQLGETQVIKSGKAAVAPTDYTATYDTDSGKVRHTFTGWDQAFNKVTEPLEIKPEYAVSYRVRFFDYDNKQIGTSQYVAEGDDATAPTTYTKTYTVGGVHYTFSGWDNSYTGITAAVDVTAQYGESYEVKFYDYDNTQLGETQVVKSGKAATAPTDYTESYDTDSGKVRHTFTGWDTTFNKVTEPLEIKPKYATSYRVRFFDYDNKQIGESQYVAEGDDAVAPTTYTKSYTVGGVHYTFSCWDEAFTGVTAAVDVTAQYGESYEVKFYDYDNTQLGETQIVKSGKAATAPTDYTATYDTDSGKVRHTFTGWDQAFNKVTEPLEIKPEYATSYRVRFFDYDNKQIGESQYVAEGEDATAPTTYTKSYTVGGVHYTFSGWDNAYTGITAAVDVTAQYGESYEVKFYDYDNTQIGETQVIKSGKAATAPSDYTESYDTDSGKVRHTFTGWDTTFNKVTEPLEIKPEYAVSYRVRFFDYDNKQIGTSQYVAEGEDATAPTTYTKSYTVGGVHYTFSGWDNAFTGVTAAVDVTAQYGESYEVKFYDYDGTQIGETQVVKSGKSATAPTDYTEVYYTSSNKIKHTFTGWDQAFNKVTEPLEIKPEYAVSYRVRFFDYDNKQIGESQYVANGEDAVAPTTYTKTYTVDGVHYTFSGWDKSFIKITAAVDVTAQYGESYEVKFFDYDGTQLGETQIIKSGKAATAPSDYTEVYYTSSNKIKHTFTKWDKAYDKVTEPLEIKPEYATSYRVRFFDYDNKQIGESQYVANGEDATAPTTYTKSYTVGGVHYTFSGWDNEFTSVSAAVDVTAQYGESYEVKFYDDEEGTVQLGETQIVKKGKAAVAPTDYTKYRDNSDGSVRYSFSGWDKDFEKITKPLEIKPTYKETLRVKFVDADGELIGEAQYVEKGESAVPPTEGFDLFGTKSGITTAFCGWSDYSVIETADTVITPVYNYIRLYDERGSSEAAADASDGTPSEDGYELPSYEATSSYNEGWFRVQSGNTAATLKPVGSTVVLTDDLDDNTFALIRYNSCVLELYESGKLKTTKTITAYRDSGSGNNYYFLTKDKETPIELNEAGVGWFVTGGNLYLTYSFDTNYGNNLSGSELMALIGAKNDLKITKVRCDLDTEDGVAVDFIQYNTNGTVTTTTRNLPVGSEVELPGGQTAVEGYNMGWFHSTSGYLPDTIEPINKYTVADANNELILVNYKPVEYTVKYDWTEDGEKMSQTYKYEVMTYNYHVAQPIPEDATDTERYSALNDLRFVLKESDEAEGINIGSSGGQLFGTQTKNIQYYTSPNGLKKGADEIKPAIMYTADLTIDKMSLGVTGKPPNYQTTK